MSISKKVVLVGHFGVGKSSLMRRFVENSFSEDYKVTIGVHIMKKEVNLNDGDKINLIIWDIEGTDDITKYRPAYLLGAAAYIYVFDVTRPLTYKDLEYNLNYIEEKNPGMPVQVVGNKTDLIDKSKFEKHLKEQNVTISYLTSAKSGEEVETMFQDLAGQLLTHA